MIFDYQIFDHSAYNQHVGHELETMMTTKHSAAIRPTDRELDSIARDVQKLFEDGIQWNDFPIIMSIASHYLQDFSNLSLESRRDSVEHILFYIIDHTDTPYLPDLFSDPLFKNMVPHFVNVIVLESLDEYLSPIKISGTPTEDIIREYAEEIFQTFEDGFQWKDLTTISKLGILFANQFIDLNFEQKKNTANDFVNYIIDNTDTPMLPDYFIDPIFKEVSNAAIEIIMDQLLIR